MDLLTALEAKDITRFYRQYFQTPGVAEAGLRADVSAFLRRITYSLSGDRKGAVATVLKPGTGFLHNTEDPETLPARIDADDMACAMAPPRPKASPRSR